MFKMSRFSRISGLALTMLFAWSAAGRGADVRAFLPKETDVVISANLRQTLDSELVKKHALDLIKTTLAGNQQAQDVFQALGLDPLKDFDQLTVGVGLEELTNPRAIVVAQGRFDTRKISDVMEKLAKDEPKKFAVEKVSGKTVYKITTDQQGPAYAAPIDAQTFVVGTSKEYLGAAFEAASGTRPIALRKEVVELLNKSDKQASLSIVAYTKGRLEAVPLPDPELRKVLEQIVSLSIDLKVTRDVTLELAIGTPGEDQAKKMREMVNTGLELAKVQVKVAVAEQAELQPLVELVNSMTAAQRGSDVRVAGKLPGSSLDKVFGKGK
jgi:hypothetical protein